MSFSDISSNIDDLSRMIDRIIVDRDSLPQPADLNEIQGSSVGVAARYHNELDRNSTAFVNILRRVRGDLDRAGEKIQATIQDINITNEAVLDAVSSLNTQVESVAVVPPSGAAQGSAAGAAGGLQ